ncbi:MAG: prepilin peptidase [Syntrophobacteraceae bacterium]
MWLPAAFPNWLQNGMICIVAVAVASDLKSRRIPNTLTVPASIAGLAVNVALHGWEDGPWTAFAGMAIAVIPPLLIFMLGGMGGGDVKLLAAIGAWLGPEGALSLLLCTALAGGVMSGALMLARPGGLASLRELKTDARLLLMTGKKLAPHPEGRTIPYSLAIAVGVLATVFLGGVW